MGCIAEFIGELRDQTWEESDIRQVEMTVRKILAGVTQDLPEAEAG